MKRFVTLLSVMTLCSLSATQHDDKNYALYCEIDPQTDQDEEFLDKYSHYIQDAEVKEAITNLADRSSRLTENIIALQAQLNTNERDSSIRHTLSLKTADKEFGGKKYKKLQIVHIMQRLTCCGIALDEQKKNIVLDKNEFIPLLMPCCAISQIFSDQEYKQMKASTILPAIEARYGELLRKRKAYSSNNND